MKSYRPNSIIQLTLIGFTFVAAPLIAALILTLINVERMAKQSEQVILSMTQAMQLSQQMGKEITEMERYARQFLLLKDASIYKLLQEEHDEIAEITQAFKSLTIDQDMATILSEIAATEAELYSHFDGAMVDEEKSEEEISKFGELAFLGRHLLLTSSLNIHKQIDALQSQARSNNRLLYMQSIVLIPVALGLAILFTILITRPLRQIDRSIRELGTGNFSEAIKVNGPRDLEELGERLEWLRLRLEELEAQKISVLRYISHNLKTPLTALREGTELLSDDILGTLNHDQREISWILKSNALKLQQQVEELLTFSVTGEALRDDIRENIPLRSLLQDVLKEHYLEIKAKKIAFKGRIDECEIQGDPTQVRVILDNIFSNAIKYSPENGKIIVQLRSSNDDVVLDVVDQGPGIAPEEKDRVFEAFYQGKTASKGHVKGTGLGLAIAQEFAQLHKGVIESIAESVGAHFRLTLARES